MGNTELKRTIASLLGKEITHFELKGKGMCNNAYYLETSDGNNYLVKEERPDKETDEQNNLVVEGGLIQRLNMLDPSLPVPQIAFVSESPRLYGYSYLQGVMMVDLWPSLLEEKRISLCESVGNLHAQLGRLIDENTARDVGLVIDFDNTVPESYDSFLNDTELPADWKSLAQEAYRVYNETHDQAIFQCIHNDAHNENVILNAEGELVSFIDFGDSEFADVHKDFCYYVRHYPDYVKYVIDSYQKSSGNEISEKRVILYALLRDLDEVAWYFHNPEDEQKRLLKSPGILVAQRVENYKKLLGDYI